MSGQVSVEIRLSDPRQQVAAGVVVVREYDEERDKVAVEELERRCEFEQQGKPSLVTDHMGDPSSRIRNFPSFIMLVAEYGDIDREIVGIISGCIKTVTRGSKTEALNRFQEYVKVAYILGLRVSPTRRRYGIGTKLVQELEKWSEENGADYAYMVTDCANESSINLFTLKCEYVRFRTPAILVQPVHAHYKVLDSETAIVRVPRTTAESIYRRIFSNLKFFPKDLDIILKDKLNLGTFMAMPKKYLPKWDINSNILPSCSFAILSIWNTKEVYKLQAKGVPALTYAWCAGSRVLDKLMPWLRLPSIPNVFNPFGFYFLYGLHMEGYGASQLMKSLCTFAHNLGKDDVGCGAVVAAVGQWDPVRETIPHWKRFSWGEDVWCIKRLRLTPAAAAAAANQEVNHNCGPYDWLKSSSVIFVDPRDF